MEFTSVPFQELADKIARAFIEDGVDLEDGVVREAKARDLTPEEIKRLVEKSNTAASVLYLRSSGDKKGTFTLASVSGVLGKTHPDEEDEEEEGEEKTASEFPVTRFGGLEKQAVVAPMLFGSAILGQLAASPLLYTAPLYVAMARNNHKFQRAMAIQNHRAQQAFRRKALLTGAAVGAPVAAGGVAVAANNMDAVSQRHAQQAEEAKARVDRALGKTAAQYNSAKKHIAEKKVEKTACEQEMGGQLSALRRMFLYKLADFDQFAAESQALFPKTAASVVKGIATALKIEPKQVKIASFIDDSAPELVIMRSLDKNMRKHAEISSEIEQLEAFRDDFIRQWKEKVLK